MARSAIFSMRRPVSDARNRDPEAARSVPANRAAHALSRRGQGRPGETGVIAANITKATLPQRGQATIGGLAFAIWSCRCVRSHRRAPRVPPSRYSEPPAGRSAISTRCCRHYAPPSWLRPRGRARGWHANSWTSLRCGGATRDPYDRMCVTAGRAEALVTAGQATDPGDPAKRGGCCAGLPIQPVRPSSPHARADRRGPRHPDRDRSVSRGRAISDLLSVEDRSDDPMRARSFRRAVQAPASRADAASDC